MIQQEILHFHVCGGAGGGAKGFNRGQARVGHVLAKPRCIGAVDVDAAGIIDFDRVSGTKGTVIDLFRHLVAMEASSTFSFQPERWLADVAPALLPASLATDIEQAKRDSADRRRIEAAMPSGLRYVNKWPPRLPTQDEAAAIVEARRPILARHHLAERFATPAAVITRFEELLAAKAEREARKEAA